MEKVDRLEVGSRTHKITFQTTRAVVEELQLWADIAQWSVSKVIHYLLVKGIRSYDGELIADVEQVEGSKAYEEQ